MFRQINFFQNGFEKYVHSLGVKSYSYGNATHAFADILERLYDDGTSPKNILMPSFLPAKLYKTVLAYGYIPRSYEIDQNCKFDVKEIHSLINSNTKAIFAIHYFGYPAKIRILREIADEYNIVLIEDCAHVIFARDVGGILGTWGDFSIFSPRKMLVLPEGGYLVLNKKYSDFQPSYNKRVNSIYTISKLVQTRGKHFYFRLTNGNDLLHLSKIPQRGYIDFERVEKSSLKNISMMTSLYSRSIDVKTHVEKRQLNYSYLLNGIKNIQFLKPLYNENPVSWTPYSFPVVVEEGFRDLLQQQLAQEGISCGAGWPESPFEKRFIKTSVLARNLLELPVHPYIIKSQLDKIIDVCKNFDKSIKSDKEKNRRNVNHSKKISLFTIPGPADHPDFKLEQITLQTLSSNFSTSDNIRSEIIRTENDFDNLKTEWEELCDDSNVHIFQTFEWQRTWWKYFGKDKQLYLVLFYTENNFRVNKLVGIAPFFIDTKYFGSLKILSRLRLIGSGVEKNKSKHNGPEYGVSDYLDLIIQSGYEKQVVNSLADLLKVHSDDYDIIQLDEVNSNSLTINNLFPLFKDSKWKLRTIKRDVCPRVQLNETLNEFYAKLNPKVRYQLKKILRDLNDNASLSISSTRSINELEKSYNDFVDLHQKRWNRIGLPGLFSDPDYKKFLGEIVHSFHKKGYLNFTTIYSGNKCLAAECAFEYKNHYYDYLKAFDNQSPLAKYRPGKALLILLIDNAINKKAKAVDLLRGGEDYKFEFTSELLWTYKMMINNPVSAHRFRYFVFLSIMFFVQAKHYFLNELNIIVTLTRNFGFLGFTARYIPSTAKKIKNKLRSFIFKNIFIGHQNKKLLSLSKAEGGKKKSDENSFYGKLSFIYKGR